MKITSVSRMKTPSSCDEHRETVSCENWNLKSCGFNGGGERNDTRAQTHRRATPPHVASRTHPHSYRSASQ